MANALIVMEFKGFTAMATSLSRDTDSIGITPDRVRAAGINLTRESVAKASVAAHPTRVEHIGGDTWVLEFSSLETSLIFGVVILNMFAEVAKRHAVFFLKPSLALVWGNAKWKDGRPVDDTTISAYSVADKGKPYNFFVIGDTIAMTKQYPWVQPGSPWCDPPVTQRVLAIDWINSHPPITIPEIDHISLPALLLDAEILFSDTAEEALQNIIREQSLAKDVCAFGGPAPFDVACYREYISNTLTLIATGHTRFSVLACLPLSQPRYSYAWLELGLRVSVRFPAGFAFAAFTVPQEQVRPISYHVYDSKLLHIGLRSFIPQRDTHAMTAGLMLRNTRVAQRFQSEFTDDWKAIGSMTEQSFGKLSGELGSIGKEEKRQIAEAIDTLISTSIRQQ